MSAAKTREYLDAWKPAAERRRRTTRATHIDPVTCSRCLGAKHVLFQWFDQQVCPACGGTGETDE
jgi:DnaJ-class molecular chaperone